MHTLFMCKNILLYTLQWGKNQNSRKMLSIVSSSFESFGNNNQNARNGYNPPIWMYVCRVWSLTIATAIA